MPSTDAVRYARTKRRLMLVDMLFSLVLLWAVHASGLSVRMAHWARQWSSAEVLVIAAYLLAFGTLMYIIQLPLHFYESFVVEHRFALSRMSFGAWCLRQLKQVLVGGVIGLLAIEALYALLRHAQQSWPLWASLGWVVFSVVLARIFPTVLLPIFYKTTPLQQPELEKRLLDLCARVKLPALGVFRFALGSETRKANAALAGLGGTRRVLLSDTLVEKFTPDEIEGVLAHELAHHRFRHISWFLLLGGAGSLAAFLITQQAAQWWVGRLGLSGIADIAGYPLLMLWLYVLGLIAMPVQNGISRYFEWQSDHFAAATTQPKLFADALRRLAELNLADPNPPRWVVWWFYDHPPIAERIAAADAAAQ